MREKNDVLFLCQYFYPEYISSATLPYDTALALVKEGLDVSVICGYPLEYSKDNNIPKKEIHRGIKINRLKYLQLNRSSFIGRLTNYVSFTLMVLLKFFSLKKYKLIIVYSNPPVLPLIVAWATKVFDSKMIFVSYDVYPEIALATNSISKDGFINTIMKYINKSIYKDINTVVALSNEMKEYLLEHRVLLKEEQVEVIPNWYEDRDTGDVSKSYINEKYVNLDPKNNLIVSYFGNMGICQDLDTILEAIRVLKNDSKIKFVFAGHGNKIGQMKKVIKQESLENVTIYDFLHGQDFQDALNISDCFLVSLEKDLTGLAVPSKTYSYMMAGKPIISIMGKESDISKDLLNNNAGYVIESGENEQLVSAIEEVKNNECKRKQMGQNSRRIFLDKYTTQKCTQQYVNLINKVLEKK